MTQRVRVSQMVRVTQRVRVRVTQRVRVRARVSLQRQILHIYPAIFPVGHFITIPPFYENLEKYPTKG